MRVSYEIQGKDIPIVPHIALAIWVNGALCGRLTVRRGEEETVLGAVVDAIVALRKTGINVKEIEA